MSPRQNLRVEPAWAPRVIWPDRTPLLTLLKAGYELLQPPSPLPTDSAALRERLERSEAVVPSHVSGVGSSHGRYCICDEAGSSSVGLGELRCLVLDRCVTLLWSVQKVLELEYVPVDQRKGLLPNDFLLGTADLRLLRTMVNLVIEHLLNLAQHFVPKLSSLSADETKPWLYTIYLVQALATPPAAMDGRTLPPTAITHYCQLHFLPHTYLSAFLLAWAPSFPPESFRDTRTGFQTRLVNSANKTLVLKTLWRTIRLADGKTGDAKSGWNRVWPGYAKVAASRMVDVVIVSDGGLRALIYGMIGEEAVLAKQPPSEKDIIMLCGMVSPRDRTSGSRDKGKWARTMLDQLYAFVSPSHDTSPPHPTHAYAACRLLESFWQKRREETTSWLTHIVFEPISRVSSLSVRGLFKAIASANLSSMVMIANFIRTVVQNVAQQSDFVNATFTGPMAHLYILCTSFSRASAWPTLSEVERTRLSVTAKSIEDLLVVWVGLMDIEAVLRPVIDTVSTDADVDESTGASGSRTPISPHPADPAQSELGVDFVVRAKAFDSNEKALSAKMARSGTLFARILRQAGQLDVVPDLLERAAQLSANATSNRPSTELAVTTLLANVEAILSESSSQDLFSDQNTFERSTAALQTIRDSPNASIRHQKLARALSQRVRVLHVRANANTESTPSISVSASDFHHTLQLAGSLSPQDQVSGLDNLENILIHDVYKSTKGDVMTLIDMVIRILIRFRVDVSDRAISLLDTLVECQSLDQSVLIDCFVERLDAATKSSRSQIGPSSGLADVVPLVVVHLIYRACRLRPDPRNHLGRRTLRSLAALMHNLGRQPRTSVTNDIQSTIFAILTEITDSDPAAVLKHVDLVLPEITACLDATINRTLRDSAATESDPDTAIEQATTAMAETTLSPDTKQSSSSGTTSSSKSIPNLYPSTSTDSAPEHNHPFPIPTPDLLPTVMRFLEVYLIALADSHGASARMHESSTSNPGAYEPLVTLHVAVDKLCRLASPDIAAVQSSAIALRDLTQHLVRKYDLTKEVPGEQTLSSHPSR